MKKVRKQVRRKETNAERKARRERIDTDRRKMVNEYKRELAKRIEAAKLAEAEAKAEKAVQVKDATELVDTVAGKDPTE